MSDFKIDFVRIFNALKFEDWCIVKINDAFPKIIIGSDIDIFCFDIDKVSSIILGILQEEISENLEIKIIQRKDQLYIDILNKKNILYRFDLYGKLPKYKNILIKPCYFSTVIENKILVENKNLKYYVPCELDECILRYIEYHEWFSERPDKLKHIDYILEKLKNTNINRAQVLNKLHYYIELPRVSDNAVKNSKNSVIHKLKYYLNKIKRKHSEIGSLKLIKFIITRIVK